MEIASALTIFFSSRTFSVAEIVTLFCFLIAIFTFRSFLIPFINKTKSANKSRGSGSDALVRKIVCGCACSCDSSVVASGSDSMALESSTAVNAPLMNGGAANMLERTPVMVTERQIGASMMEQLVPEITTHALSYLDYPSLCRLSMTNSSMRKAANDDNAWKALYHKDFTFEQDTVTPINGWKAYYAATRAIVNINAEFFRIIRERSIQDMSHFWLNADYVKCIHASGEFFSGYNAVIQSWQLAFNWEQGVNFQVRDVRARVLSDVAWISLKTYVDMDTGPFNVTNIYEFHNGRWYMVHHHSSVMEMEQQIMHG